MFEQGMHSQVNKLCAVLSKGFQYWFYPGIHVQEFKPITGSSSQVVAVNEAAFDALKVVQDVQ